VLLLKKSSNFEATHDVIPAKAGIQGLLASEALDPGFRRDDVKSTWMK